MTVIERVSYLKGLADGLGLDDDSKQDKLIKAVIEALEDISLVVSDLEDAYDDLTDQIDAVDEDLAMLEDDIYGEEDGCGCGCDIKDDLINLDGDLIYDDESLDSNDNFYEIECPACKDTIYLDEDMMKNGSIDCPNCSTELEFDINKLDNEEKDTQPEN